MKLIRKIIVATDSRLSDQNIVKTAFEIAKHHGASLMIVDVVQELNWAAKIVVKDVDDVRAALRSTVTDQLTALAQPYLGQGVEVATKLLEGKTSVSIIREVMASECDLLIAVNKGKDSRNKGNFGQTAKQLLRNCPCPLLLTPRGVQPEFKHVTACVDTSTDDSLDAELNEKVYQAATAMSEQYKARLSVLHAWKMADEALMRARLDSESVDRYLEATYEYHKSQLSKFIKQYRAEGTEGDLHLIKGSAPEAIEIFTTEDNVDLVVMGTVARSGLFGMMIGNTAENMLENIQCSVLAIKPYSFKSSIT